MKQWEHLMFTCSPTDLVARLDAAGAEGWQLVSIVRDFANVDYLTAVMRREKQ